MKRAIMGLLIVTFAVLDVRAIDLRDMIRGIEVQKNAAKRATDNAAAQAKQRSDREAEERRRREAAQRAETAAARALKVAEEERIRNLTDIQNLRAETQRQLDALTKANLEMASLRRTVDATQDRLREDRRQFDNERAVFNERGKLLSAEKALLHAQRSQAEESKTNWVLGFIGACLGCVATIFKIIHARAELKKMKPALAFAQVGAPSTP